MKLTPPKQVTFWLAVILAVVGAVSKVVSLGTISGFAFPLIFFGFLLLVLGNVMEGL
jgi:hypothetical protein